MYARENNFRFVWFIRGKIMLREKEGDVKVRVIKSEADLLGHN